MTSPASTTPIDRILAALQQGDQAKGDLLDVSGCKSYTELEALLNPLIETGEVTLHFADLGYRVYRLGTRPKHTLPPWLSNQNRPC